MPIYINHIQYFMVAEGSSSKDWIIQFMRYVILKIELAQLTLLICLY